MYKAKSSITFNGKTKTISQWAKELGFSHQAIGWRLTAGWSVKDALGTPTRQMKARRALDLHFVRNNRIVRLNRSAQRQVMKQVDQIVADARRAFTEAEEALYANLHSVLDTHISE